MHVARDGVWWAALLGGGFGDGVVKATAAVADISARTLLTALQPGGAAFEGRLLPLFLSDLALKTNKILREQLLNL